MLDFVIAETNEKAKTVSPAFSIIRRKDLMSKGGKLEAFYNERTRMWSDDIIELCEQIDEKIEDERDRVNTVFNGYKAIPISISSTHKWDDFVKYLKNLNDKFVTLDPKVTFADQETSREDYCAHKLDYVMAPGDCSAWHTLVGRLYTEEDKRKIEWAIGALITGDSRKIQKCIFIEGQPGKGKSTIFEIMQNMFPHYCTAFKAEALGDEHDKFALSAFSKNPLMAFDADAKLSNMTATNRMNQVIGHDKMCVEEKFKAPYTMRITTMLFMASNYKMNITSSQSGMMRRTILIKPTEDTFPRDEYDDLMRRIEFEYGAICDHCLNVYLSMGPAYYDGYRDKRLIGESNDLYNFLKDNYVELISAKFVTVNALWVQFRQFLEQNNTVQIQHRKLDFENDIKNYFDTYTDRKYGAYKVLEGFKSDLFEFTTYEDEHEEPPTESTLPEWLQLKEDFSIDENVLNIAYADRPAQEADNEDHPKYKWDNVKTTLKDISTTKVHYVLPPDEQVHVVIDFDLKDENGNKNLDLNLEAAKIFPETYAEVSKGGAGLHLHYIYEGDPDAVSSIYAPGIEILVFKGKRALRRRLSLCNNRPIAVLKEGQLPKKEVKEVVNDNIVMNEKAIRTTIARCLRKEIHPDTTSNVNMIQMVLEKAYASDTDYDVSDMKQAVYVFAKNSTNQALTNIKKVNKMHFMSKKFEEAAETNEPTPSKVDEKAPLVVLDIEIWPNLFLVCWKIKGQKGCTRWYNPTAEQIRTLLTYRFFGYYNREYDNHMLYAAANGYSVAALYDLSRRLTSDDKDTSRNAKFREAYNASWCDVYDMASAGNKKSLKKWQIELGIYHLENEHPWDQPLDEKYWEEAGNYCCNDVESTEIVFDHLSGDFAARKILAKLSGLTVNDKTNDHTIRILCGDKKHPQSEYIYTDLSKEFPGYEYNPYGFKEEDYKPGTKIISGKSRYMGEDPGEGGYKIANPGYYVDVDLLDIASMHPSSAIALNVFGDEITGRFKALKDGRVEVKHVKEIGDEHYVKALDILSALGDNVRSIIEDYYREGVEAGESVKHLSKDLANALKTAINSVYGLTSAPFPNKLKDPRNVDNVVAKRGALFMLTLKHKLVEMGVTIVHISTDSIKIAQASQEVIDFIFAFGKQYGYDFEHEAHYDRMCIVNDAVYIAHESEADGKPLDEPFWTPTGKQFQVPYVFKSLFSHEDVKFDDLVIPFQVQTALYLQRGEDDYKFIGRFGSFVPVKETCPYASVLLRDAGNGKYAAATGTKGYLWAEAEAIKLIEKDPLSVIDWSYYEDLANKAKAAIDDYVPFEEFAA